MAALSLLPPPKPAPPPPSVAAPTAADRAEPLQRYLGQQVTLVGTVGQVYSDSAVTLVLGGASNGNQGEGNTKQQALLVLSKSSVALQPGSSVQARTSSSDGSDSRSTINEW